MHDILSHYVPRRTNKSPLQGYAKFMQEREEEVSKAFAAYTQQSQDEGNYIHHEEDYDSDGLDERDGSGRAYAMTGYTLAAYGAYEMPHPIDEPLRTLETGQPLRHLELEKNYPRSAGECKCGSLQDPLAKGTGEKAPRGQVPPVEGTGEKKENGSHGGEQGKVVLCGGVNNVKGAPPPERDKAVQKGVTRD
jgi:hypothetical protein